MSTKIKYKTKQNKEMIAYLETRKGKHLTVSDIHEYFKAKGKAIGVTTVYRQLERMVDDGVVKKYKISNDTPACFEYIGFDSVSEYDSYHCKCDECGKLIHLECNELKEVQKHLLNNHRFKMSAVRTVIYGVCDECLINT